MVGEFMKYLPATVILVLLTALFMALVFMPVTGVLLTRQRKRMRGSGWMSWTMRKSHLWSLADRFVDVAGEDPGPVFGVPGAGLCDLWSLQSRHRFFPDVEPDSAQLRVHARGSVHSGKGPHAAGGGAPSLWVGGS